MSPAPPFEQLGDRFWWGYPLTNFVSDLRRGNPDFDLSPLRFKYANESEDLADRNDSIYANMAKGVVEFRWRGLPAYIQAVPEYSQVIDALNDGHLRSAVTAMALGPLPEGARNTEAAKNHIPTGLLRLLSLATGSEVGTSGLQTFDPAGNPVGWLNDRHDPPYFRNRNNVSELSGRGISQLIESSLASPFFDTRTFTVVSQMLVRSKNDYLTFEESLSLQFRALETLCDDAGIKSQNKTSEVVSGHMLGQLEEIALRTREDIQSVLAKAVDESSREQLRWIKSTIKHDVGRRVGLGKRIELLAESLGLNDAKVLEPHRFASSSARSHSWSSLLSHYRNIVQHSGSIDMSDYPHEAHPADALYYHLYDLILRILLLRLGYHGKYQPTTIRDTATFELTWVKPGTDIRMLGYGTTVS